MTRSLVTRVDEKICRLLYELLGLGLAFASIRLANTCVKSTWLTTTSLHSMVLIIPLLESFPCAVVSCLSFIITPENLARSLSWAMNGFEGVEILEYNSYRVHGKDSLDPRKRNACSPALRRSFELPLGVCLGFNVPFFAPSEYTLTYSRRGLNNVLS